MQQVSISLKDFYLDQECIIDDLLRIRAIGHIMSIADVSEVGDNIPLLGLEIIDKCNQCIKRLEEYR